MGGVLPRFDCNIKVWMDKKMAPKNNFLSVYFTFYMKTRIALLNFFSDHGQAPCDKKSVMKRTSDKSSGNRENREMQLQVHYRNQGKNG